MKLKLKSEKRRLVRLAATLIMSLLMVMSVAVVSMAETSDALGLDAQADGQTVTVTVTTDGSTAIGSMQFVLKYESDKLLLEDVSIGPAYRSMIYAQNTNIDGEIHIAAAAAGGITPEHAMLTATFKEKADVTVGTQLNFDLENVLVADENGSMIYEVDSGASASISAESAGTSITTETSVTAILSDVSGSWAEDKIRRACEEGLMQDLGDGKFGPEKSLTRAQMAQILYNNAGKPAVASVSIQTSKFKDLTAAWYQDAVAWALEKGYFHGMGDGTFKPDGTLTREQLAQVLMNCSGQTSGAEMLFMSIYDSQYADSSSVDGWAKPALYWSIYKGILCGTSSESIGSTLSPTSAATRAQIAVMMVNYKDAMAS